MVVDGSLAVIVFDYVHWKLHVASFFLKSFFSFLKRRDLSDSERFSSPSAHMLFASIFPPGDSFTSTPSLTDAYTFNKELIIQPFILQIYVQWFLTLEQYQKVRQNLSDTGVDGVRIISFSKRPSPL